MRVLLVQGYLGSRNTDTLVYPIGLSYIATALSEDGHDVRIFDPNVHEDGLGKLHSELGNYQPDLVGVSLRNTDSACYLDHRDFYAHLGRTLKTIRRARPSAPIVIGGTGFSTFPEKIMRDHGEIDFGVPLEGEETAVELLRNLEHPSTVPGLYYRDGERTKFSGVREFSSHPDDRWPRRDFLDLTPYLSVSRSVGVQSNRGCPLNCVYCNYPTLNGGKTRSRSASDVVDEIEHLRGEHSVREISFVDSVFDVDRSYAAEICEELIKRALPIRWSAWFETRDFEEEWFSLARLAGCRHFYFSPDGATDRTMRALGKRCRERDVERVLDLAARHPDVEFNFSLLCGVPGQNWRDVWRSLRFIWKTHFLLRNSRCFLNWIRIYPNTPLYRQLLATGDAIPESELLPALVTDHRPLYFIAPESPRLATPLIRYAFSLLDALRRFRERGRARRPARDPNSRT